MTKEERLLKPINLAGLFRGKRNAGIAETGYDNKTTTDDHSMHITGICKRSERYQILHYQELMGN